MNLSTSDLEQRNIDASNKTFGLEDEDILSALALILFNLIFHKLLKPVIFDPFLGEIYNNIFFYFFQLLVLMPVLLLAGLKIIKYKKTKGYILNTLFLIDTGIGTTYNPFEHYNLLKRKEGIK